MRLGRQDLGREGSEKGRMVILTCEAFEEAHMHLFSRICVWASAYAPLIGADFPFGRQILMTLDQVHFLDFAPLGGLVT